MDERAVSVPVNYSQALIITTILLAGLMLATAGEVRSQRDRTIESEFQVLSNRIAADLSAADRLVATLEEETAPGENDVSLTTSLPPTVAGSSYEAVVSSTSLGPDAGYRVEVTLSADRGDTQLTYRLKTGTEVLDATIAGGEYSIVYDPGSDALEVRDG